MRDAIKADPDRFNGDEIAIVDGNDVIRRLGDVSALRELVDYLERLEEFGWKEMERRCKLANNVV
jgi:hypothetical protein